MLQDTDTLIQHANQVHETANKDVSYDLDWFIGKGIDWGTSLVIAIIVLIVGMFIAKRLTKVVKRLLTKKDFDESLQKFLISLVSISLRILVVLTALGQLGVEMTSFVALIGAAGLAIGMAFSGTLGNFAGGIMILIFRPYKVGDYVNAQGEEGIIHEIQIFNTIILTLDNKTVIVPNGAMANGNITNFTMQDLRRVDFVVGIGYGDDYLKAKKVLERFIAEDEKILKDPAPFIGLGELGDSSVNITLRVWGKTPDYWDIFFKMNEKIYTEFDKEGLNIPFPQMDVHLHKTDS
ncbi:MAG: mechanosensitive ion channel domain-containing protein [Crocinitomicaceae bacterium]